MLNIILCSSIHDVSTSSKIRSFCPLQMHNIKHKGTHLLTSSILPHLTVPPQLTNKSLTFLDIIQVTPNVLRIKLYNSTHIGKAILASPIAKKVSRKLHIRLTKIAKDLLNYYSAQQNLVCIVAQQYIVYINKKKKKDNLVFSLLSK
jgi:hypothetical protein